MSIFIEGDSERFRRDESPPNIVRRVLAFVARIVTAFVNDGIDLYHGNLIADETKIPTFKFAVHKLTEGATSIDFAAPSRLAMFVRRLIRIRGVYHWLRSDSSAADQWANFDRQLKANGLVVNGQLIPGVFLMLDWERTYKTLTTAIPDCPVSLVVEWLRLARAAYGDRVCVYSADWVPGFIVWRAANPTIPVWYACYSKTLALAAATKYAAMCLQWTSSAIVPGMSAPVDASQLLIAAQLDRIAGTAVAPPVIVPPVVIRPPVVAKFNPLPDPLPKEDLMICILRVNEDGATLVGTGSTQTVNGVAKLAVPEARWTGPGNTPERIDAITAWLNTLREFGAHDVAIDRAACKNITCVGALPSGYVNSDFAPNTGVAA